MYGIGYVVGDTLESIQHQYVELLDVDVNLILFDRNCLRNNPEDRIDINSFTSEQKEIWHYMESMRAGQSITSPASGDYLFVNDLKEGDTLVLTSLDVLSKGAPNLWSEIYQSLQSGSHLAILSDGFHSAGEGGGKVVKMMNDLFVVAKGKS